MADENETNAPAGVTEAITPVEVAPPKKRGARQKNVASEAGAETSKATSARAVGGRAKRAEKGGAVKAAARSAKTGAKSTVTQATGARAPKVPAETPASAPEGLADLIQLEEENVRLRKALADKLRAENADLRKRLGLA